MVLFGFVGPPPMFLAENATVTVSFGSTELLPGEQPSLTRLTVFVRMIPIPTPPIPIS
jgi:hypothetical protein